MHSLPCPADLHAEFFGCDVYEVADAVLHAGGYDEVFRSVLLQHKPLHFDIVFCVAPVSFGIQVAEVEGVLQAEFDAGKRACDLAGDEGFPAHGAFVVKEDSIAGVKTIGLAIVDGDPVGVELGNGVGAARVEGGGFPLGDFLHQPVEFAGTGLVESSLLP